MRKIQNLLNKKFGKLTVIAPTLIDEKYRAWLCKCDCGNEKKYTFSQLNNWAKSCGCLRKSNLINKRFGRLVVIKKAKSVSNGKTVWLCRCDCGNEKNIKDECLKRKKGATKSCGCLNDELLRTRFIKYEPREGSAMKVWSNNYNDGDITFEKFYYELSQQNCFYCQAPPSNKANAYNDKKCSEYRRNNGDFIYSGLDRVNSNLPHDLNNVVPCCSTCNTSKGIKTQEEFFKWADELYKSLKSKNLL